MVEFEIKFKIETDVELNSEDEIWEYAENYIHTIFSNGESIKDYAFLEIKKDIKSFLQKEIHDMAIAMYNDMTDYLEEPISDDVEEIKKQLERLYGRVHEDDIEMRDAWAEAAGEARYILVLADENDIDIPDEELIILDNIASLFK